MRRDPSWPIHKRRLEAHEPRVPGQVLDDGREPPVGAHVLTPRRGYIHHGIYVGRGRVVHYRGFSNGLRRGPVEEVQMAKFAGGRPVWVRGKRASVASPEEVVRRARLRIGENRYRLFTNNCEHFCEWCLSGDPRSFQVEALSGRCIAWLRRFASIVSRSALSQGID